MDNQAIDDVLTTALEGGINYWSGREQVLVTEWPTGASYASECVSRGKPIDIPETDEDTGKVTWHRLTRAQMVRGITEAAKHWRLSVDAFIEECDADRADTAVQFALFNEIVYG